MRPLLLWSCVSFLVFSAVASAKSFSSENQESSRYGRKRSELEKYYGRHRTKFKDDSPCKTLRKECIQAGFTQNGRTGKNLKKDCEDKLLLGRKVSGVNLLSGLIESCRFERSSQSDGSSKLESGAAQ